jgi:hypothetical protein
LKTNDLNSLNTQLKQLNLENDQENIPKSPNDAVHTKIDTKQSKLIPTLQPKKNTESTTNQLNETSPYWNGQMSSQKQSWASMMNNNSKPLATKNETVMSSPSMTSIANSTAASNPSSFKFSFSEIVRSSTAATSTTKANTQNSNNSSTLLTTQKTSNLRPATENVSPKTHLVQSDMSSTVQPHGVGPSVSSETTTSFTTQVNTTPKNYSSDSSTVNTTEIKPALSNSNQIIDSSNILSSLISNQNGQQYIDLDNRGLSTPNSSQIQNNARQSSANYQTSYNDNFFYHQQSGPGQPGQLVVNQQTTNAQQNRTQQYNNNSILNFNPIRNTQTSSVLPQSTVLSQHIHPQRNIMLSNGHVHLHNQIPPHHAPSPYQQQFMTPQMPQTSSDLQHIPHHFNPLHVTNATLPQYGNTASNSYDHQIYSQLYDATDYGQYGGLTSMQMYPTHSLHPQHSNLTQWPQNDQTIYATNGNQQQSAGPSQDDSYTMPHLYSTIPMNYHRMQQHPQQFGNTGPTQTQQYHQSANSYNNATINNSQSKLQLDYKNNITGSLFSTVGLIDDLNEQTNNLNFSNYVLFPSENVDMQLQSQQQPQHQSYYQIEDVLANLMR